MTSILIIRLSSLGDVAMTIPVISSFIKKYPDVHITMLSKPQFAGMFSGIANLDFVGIDTKNEYGGFFGLLRFFRHFRKKRKFDVVFDLHDVLRSKILRLLFRLYGAPVFAIRKGRKEKRELTRPDNKKQIQLKSSFERYRDVFEKGGFSFPLDFSGLFPKNMDLPQNIRALLGEKEGKWLAIAPFAQHAGKVYPVEKIKTVIDYFSQNGDVKILLFGGGENEKKILEEWEKTFPHVISLAGKFGLHDELQILNRADVLLSMDSANMHLASLVQTPVVSVWGATHPFAGFYGFGQSNGNVVQVDLPCRPCSIYGNKPCLRQDYACLNMITSHEIIEKIEKIFGE